MQDIPTWIQSVVKESDGHGIHFIMTKKITKSDWNPQQNRLLIPKQSINEIQLMLSQKEKTLANLNPTVTEDLGGLHIRVFTRNKFRIEELKLQRWNGTGSSVINGRGMNAFRAWSNLNVADIVEMWGFRDGRDGKLCFAIGKV